MFLTKAQKEGFRLPQASESFLYDIENFQTLVSGVSNKKDASKKETQFSYVPTDTENGLAKSKCFAENPYHVYFGNCMYDLNRNVWVNHTKNQKNQKNHANSGSIFISRRICSDLSIDHNQHLQSVFLPDVKEIHQRFVHILDQFGYSDIEIATTSKTLGRLLHPFSKDTNENPGVTIITIPWILNVFESIFPRIQTDLCTPEKSVYWNSEYCKRLNLDTNLFRLAHECRIAIVDDCSKNTRDNRVSMLDLKMALQGEAILIQSNCTDDDESEVSEYLWQWSTHLVFTDPSILESIVNTPIFMFDGKNKTNNMNLNRALKSAFLPNEIPFLVQAWNQAYLGIEMNTMEF